MLLPLVIKPGAIAENVKKILQSIISDKYSFSSSLKLLTAIQMIDEYARMNLKVNPASSVLDRAIKDYIAENYNRFITLDELSSAVGKTPNYLNSVFKSVNGITINKYISEQRIKMLCQYIQRDNMNFSDACKEVGINEVSYGYRLFKKYIGITPSQFISGEKFIRT